MQMKSLYKLFMIQELVTGVSKCTEIIFQNGKMVRREGLKVLKERMKTMSPDENDIYKFLGIKQADEIKTKVVVPYHIITHSLQQ